MNDGLLGRVGQGLTRQVEPAISMIAARLGSEENVLAVLFYGSNLRTGSLDGVLDFYVLLSGVPETGIWPRVSYREWTLDGVELRAKIATMTLRKFTQACSGELFDTTIWARFVQPSALVWCRDDQTKAEVGGAVAAACVTAARLAAVLGPKEGSERAFWIALFEATYCAEFRIEKSSRAQSILDFNAKHFDGLLPPALNQAGIDFTKSGDELSPQVTPLLRHRIARWWKRRRRLGKPINMLRLVRAASTFDGAARYAAWKIERHSGVPIEVTPWRERHPVLAAPGVLFQLWRARREG